MPQYGSIVDAYNASGATMSLPDWVSSGAAKEWLSSQQRQQGREERFQEFEDRLADPSYGIDVFQRLAASSGPSKDALFGYTAARGGTPAQAREAFESSQQQAGAQAYDAFRRFRLNADQNALGALQAGANYGLDLESQRLQRNQFAQQNDLGNQITQGLLGMGAYAGGQYLSSQFTPRMGGDPYASQYAGNTFRQPPPRSAAPYTDVFDPLRY